MVRSLKRRDDWPSNWCEWSDEKQPLQLIAKLSDDETHNKHFEEENQSGITIESLIRPGTMQQHEG